MIDHNLSYVEVIPDQTNFESWKEIVLNTGGTQSTLQDIRITERADGFCYRDANNYKSHYFTRNRFIYWKICHDVLELVEQSLDINLYSNKIRYRFLDTPILDGVSIHETSDKIILLVPTVCSVHKLIFPHPRRLHKQDEYLGASKELKYPSIFTEVVNNESKNSYSFYVFSIPRFTDTQIPHLACSTLGPEEEGIFLLAYPSGDFLLVNHFSNEDSVTIELKTESLMPRFLTGLAEKLIHKSQDYKNIVSMSLIALGDDIYGLTLSRDAQIKFWSLSRKQCVAAINILAEAGDPSQMIQNSQNYILRKAVDGDDSDCIFAVFVSFVTESKFLILEPVILSDRIDVRRLFTIHSPERDLIDFSLSLTRIWSVWRTEAGACVVYTASLSTDNYDTNTWVPVILENLPDADNVLSQEGDPREIYTQSIFYPGRFPLHIINKALSIYKKSAVIADINLSASSLKQKVCMAVENEIRSELKQNEVTDEEYLECASWCWQKFYSCCIQYHIAGLKPLGLLLLPYVSGAVLLKKSSFSFLRPMDPLEHMVLCNEYTSKGQLLSNNLLSEDIDLIENIIKLINVIVYLEEQLSEHFDYEFEKELFSLKSPDVIVSELLDKIRIEMDSMFSSEISRQLSQCHHLYKVIHKILDLIRFESDRLDDIINQDALQLYFSSQLGISVLAKCIQQQAKVRFIVCRNLLLIAKILVEEKHVPWDTLEAIRSVCTPDLVIFTQANFVVLWLCSLPVMPFVTQETALQRISFLKFNPVISNRNTPHPASLIEWFVGSVSNYELAKVPIRRDEADTNLGHWHLSLLPFVNHLFHIVWPISKKALLPEWLVANGQHLWLQQYSRLLNKWCEWNSNTRCFLLGISLLVCGEFYKATECFQLSVKGLCSERYFTHHLLKISGRDNLNENEVYVSYYLKVIKILEVHNAKDHAIKVASTALCKVGPSDPAAATLYSIKFKHHLDLKHYKKAFDSLNANPDSERKNDSLRDLVKKLLDEKKFDVLLSFTYGKLEALFVNILFTRARATEAMNNVFYDFLYCYLIMRGTAFLRLAASVMYEQAFRLDQGDSVQALQKQVKCLLAAYNALSLCDPKWAWVVKPAPETVTEKVVVIPGRAGSKNEKIKLHLKPSVEVLEVDDIKKEAVLLTAKLKLVKSNEKLFQSETSPNDLVVMLSCAGFFKDALSIATLFKLSYVPIFEILTKQCILLMEKNETQSCLWLIENDLQDFSVKKDAINVAWSLLQDFLNQYEEDKLSVLHYAVGKKMISMRIYMPFWFMASYKKRNPAELLRLLHFHGRLLEAVEVAKEYILAVMGHGSENYGITQPFLATTPPIYFPARAVDSLLYELELQNEKNPDGPLVKEREILKDLFVDYLRTAVRISNEACRINMYNSNK